MDLISELEMTVLEKPSFEDPRDSNNISAIGDSLISQIHRDVLDKSDLISRQEFNQLKC